jgi:transcriptional regulator with XRE-family HTH domain
VTFFQFDIGSRARNAGRFIGRVREELLKALSERKKDGKLSQQELARKLDVHRSVINRQLTGEANLTLRALADLAWAMDMEISFELRKPSHRDITSTLRACSSSALTYHLYVSLYVCSHCVYSQRGTFAYYTGRQMI